MAKVSIIMPCYNYGKYVDEAVNSVLDQTFQDFEIIIVNDGSTDNFTNELLSNYNKPKTKVISIKNQGPSIARNIGIEHATGEYILPLDADDKIESTYLEKGVELLDKNPKLGIVYCEAEYIGERVGKWELPPYSFEHFILENMIFSTAFFRKSAWKKVGGYNPNMIHGMEDYDFWISLIELGMEVYRIPESLFYYRVKVESRTTKLNDYNLEMFVQIYHNHEELYSKNIEILLGNRIMLLKKLDYLNKAGRIYSIFAKIYLGMIKLIKKVPILEKVLKIIYRRLIKLSYKLKGRKTN
jgi:glycosyltransferase involved in cell wall biosynthesis